MGDFITNKEKDKYESGMPNTFRRLYFSSAFGSFDDTSSLILLRRFYLLHHNVLHLLAASCSLGGALDQNCWRRLHLNLLTCLSPRPCSPQNLPSLLLGLCPCRMCDVGKEDMAGTPEENFYLRNSGRGSTHFLQIWVLIWDRFFIDQLFHKYKSGPVFHLKQQQVHLPWTAYLQLKILNISLESLIWQQVW